MRSLCWVVVVGLWGGAVQAQEQSAAQARREADPAAVQNVLLPTAETVPRGDVVVGDLNLVGAISAGIGLTDDLQLTVGAVPIALAGYAACKWQVVRMGRMLVAFQPIVLASGMDGKYAVGGGASVLADFLLDSQGRVVLSLAGSAALVKESTGGGPGGVVAAGLTSRVGRVTKLMLETTWPISSQTEPDWLLVSYGVRFFGPRFAGQLAMVLPLKEGQILPDLRATPWLLGFPALTLTARF